MIELWPKQKTRAAAERDRERSLKKKARMILSARRAGLAAADWPHSRASASSERRTLFYDRVMVTGPFFDEDFKAAVPAAGARARIETLAAGVSVFYRDDRRKIDVMEEASGRKFEIRFLHDEPSDQNYQVIRELHETAA